MKDGFYILRKGKTYEFFQILDGNLYTHKRGSTIVIDDVSYQVKSKPHMFGPVEAAATWLETNKNNIREVTESEIFVEMI